MNLDFKNAVFNRGINVTCRRGDKWAGVQYGDRILITDNGQPTGKVAVIEDVDYCAFNEDRAQDYIKFEHDPACRTFDGLLAVMKATYGEDFSPDEAVTWLAFTVEAKAENILKGA